MTTLRSASRGRPALVGLAIAVVAVVWACGSGADTGKVKVKVKDKAKPPATAAGAAASAEDMLLEGTAAPVPAVAGKKKPTAMKVYTSAIKNDDEFMAYSRELGGERFTKFVIDLKTDAIYYFDVNVYRIHTEFIFAEFYKKPITMDGLREFNKNYTSVKPQWLMCYLVHHLGPDLWTMAFWEGDEITAEYVKHAYKRMKETFYLADKVKFRPDSTMHEKIAAALPKDIPVITNDKIYKEAEYQAFNVGKAVGVLRIVPEGVAPEELTFKPEEIVILPESLPDITPVAGILSETFSTPLAHVSLRARAWGIPNVGLKKAREKYKALAGKVVYFEATAKGHVLREATPAEVKAWKESRDVAKAVIIPKADLAARDLRPLTKMRAVDVVAYGAKGANLGEIVHAGLSGFEVPAGFGIPIYYYDQHMKNSGLDKKVTALLADKKFRDDAAYRKTELEKLRAAIAKAPLDPDFCKTLTKAVHDMAADKGVFVRSSTNAEDLPGFNGAGLYDTVPNVKGDAALYDAVRSVWASVWNLRAYEEREFFKIDHTRVYGAILVQIGIDATAAGVLITTHPYDPSEKTTYTINAKSGLGMRVVEGKKVPESLLFDYSNLGIKVLSRSDEDTMLVFDEKSGGLKEVPNPLKGKPVLSDERAYVLVEAARSIVEVFPKDRPLDIEWVFKGDDLFIVQARPYVTH
ncbi:MAG TPA: PEP/pyruvate-binding domain-containing protein [Myxococcota bacterium]|jgi:hypothetical protein|nr:PEP/pyruvate-binding domain-containing protein [Myxococcota bacterium]